MTGITSFRYHKITTYHDDAKLTFTRSKRITMTPTTSFDFYTDHNALILRKNVLSLIVVFTLAPLLNLYKEKDWEWARSRKIEWFSLHLPTPVN